MRAGGRRLGRADAPPLEGAALLLYRYPVPLPKFKPQARDGGAFQVLAGPRGCPRPAGIAVSRWRPDDFMRKTQLA